jgi:hypothetical protein
MVFLPFRDFLGNWQIGEEVEQGKVDRKGQGGKEDDLSKESYST